MADIVEKMVRTADASRREDGSDTPLGDQCREAASEIERLRSALAAEREECAKVADRCSDDETRKALGANATIVASQIATAIRNRK
jgi:hypothetical protein